jgi:cell division protein ZapA (FtsZ GTPase activity inhibitor)
MTRVARVEFELLGRRFTVKSEARPEYVRELVSHVERTIKEIATAENQDPVKLAVLAALYIADELFRTREARSQDAVEAARRVAALVELLDTVTPSSPLST